MSTPLGLIALTTQLTWQTEQTGIRLTGFQVVLLILGLVLLRWLVFSVVDLLYQRWRFRRAERLP